MLWALRGHAAVLALDFAATIAVFPGVTASVCSVANPAQTPPCAPRVAGAGRLAGARPLICRRASPTRAVVPFTVTVHTGCW